MGKKRTSIKDIANALGISITTVSFILNGKAKEKRISDEVTKKVKDYVEKVGYEPSHLAQSLRLGKSMVIVFMVEDISNSFFASIARLIEEKAYRSGYKIIYCSTDNDPEKTTELIKVFKNRKVDGFIITPPPKIEKAIQLLQDEGIAVLLFDRFLPGVECNYVVVENEKGSYEACKHLIQEGNRSIGFVSVDSEQVQMLDRKKGYQRALNEFGLQESVLMLPFHHLSLNNTGQEIQDFILKNPYLDAIFFATNYLAFEGLQALQKLQKKIPDEISVLAFDDNYFFELYQPSITAIEQPLEQIAEKLMQVMLEMLQSADNEHKISKDILPTNLKVRKSTIKSQP